MLWAVMSNWLIGKRGKNFDLTGTVRYVILDIEKGKPEKRPTLE